LYFVSGDGVGWVASLLMILVINSPLKSRLHVNMYSFLIRSRLNSTSRYHQMQPFEPIFTILLFNLHLFPLKVLFIIALERVEEEM
jgi:hypothetical protein